MRPRSGVSNPAIKPERGGLPASRGPQQRKDATALHREGQPVGFRRTVGPETLRDVLEVDRRHRSGLSAVGYRTGVSGGFPSRTARQLRTASVAMATRVSDEALAMC